MVLSVVTGEAHVALFLFIPVIYGGGLMLLSGILMFFVSFMLFFFQGVSSNGGGKGDVKSTYGGVIFIGPIPVVFGKDAGITRTMFYIGLAIASVLLLLYILILLA